MITEEQDQRWKEHQPTPTVLYNLVLIPSEVKLGVSRERRTEKETAEAVKQMKNNKAAGLEIITADMLKYGGDNVVAKLTKLLNNC